jgi:enamine deaminase RidA (YjgF/YER057c/UK114 family)
MKKLDYDQRLAELGIELPGPPKAYYSYVPIVFSRGQLYISGQINALNGTLQRKGKLGDDATLEQAKEAARLCGLNILSHVRNACGGTLNRVNRCVRLTGYVNATPDSHEHAEAMDGCSSLIQEIFGEIGRHTRTCIGVASLPFNALIEIDAIFEIDGDEN